MDFSFSGLNNFLSSNPGVSQLANNLISGMGPKPAPVIAQQAPAVQTIQLPSSSGMSTSKMLGIGAGVLGFAVVLFLVFKRK